MQQDGTDPAEMGTILDAIPQMVWSALPDGRHDFYNRRWYEFTGLPRRAARQEEWAQVVHPDDQHRALAAWRHAIASGQDFEAEYRLRHHSGAWCWTLARALPLHAEDGSITRWYGTCTEIHALKHVQGQLEILAGELSHRIKNVFAVVNSIITLSARDTPGAEPFASALAARIRALARANDHVRPDADGHDSPTAPGPQSLQALLCALMEPYAHGRELRIMVRGADLPIGQQAATALALIIHEMATNAVKYGALSESEGRVRIDLAVAGDQLLLDWREIGGPPPPPSAMQAPAESGFGTTMTNRVSRDQLKADVTRRWLEEGLELTMRIPLAVLGL